jgi:hypothetical protein
MYFQIFTTEVASLLYLSMFAILQDSGKGEVRTITLGRN